MSTKMAIIIIIITIIIIIVNLGVHCMKSVAASWDIMRCNVPHLQSWRGPTPLLS